MNDTQEQGFRFIYLPQFASWLLQHIDAYTTELLGLFYEADLPLLKAFQHLSEEEKFLFSKQLNIEFLTNLSQNNAAGHIEAVTSRWLGNQFAHVGKLDVKAKDITLINYVRSKAQKRFINTYTGDPEIAFQLHSEIDDLSFAYNTRSINDYLQVLGERIEREEHFSRRIIEASPGITFIFDLVTQQGVYITGRVEEVIGFKPEEVFANRGFIAQQVHPDDLSLIPDLVQRVVRDKQGKPHSADYRFCNKGGHYQ
ncbi:MAG: PAS domain-containing protein, partial [Bacteroidota bacterium]|nr:PAS domain-containing protein [Bacteroidota bacterium]